MFVKVIIFLLFIVCDIKWIYIQICWSTRCCKREIQISMRRRISYWMQLGKIIGGMLLDKVTIRRIFMP